MRFLDGVKKGCDLMKKLIVFVLALVCGLGVIGCGNSIDVNSEVDVSMVGDQLPK